MPRSKEGRSDARVLLIVCTQHGEYFLVRVRKKQTTECRWKLYIKGEVGPNQTPESALWSTLERKKWTEVELACLGEVRYWKFFGPLYKNGDKPYDCHVFVAFTSIEALEKLERLSFERDDFRYTSVNRGDYLVQVHYSSPNFRTITRQFFEAFRQGVFRRARVISPPKRKKK